MGEQESGCARPTGASVGEQATDPVEDSISEKVEKEISMTAKVGAKAPDFNAPAYHQGTFTTVKLSDYLGKWVLLCFYPGDFTFV